MYTCTGHESGIPFLESSAYKDIVEGLFRNDDILVQPHISTLNRDISNEPIANLPIYSSVPYEPVTSAYSNVLGSELFSDSVYKEFGYRIADIINNEGYKSVFVFQGLAYGGRYLLNDEYNIKTSHPYRDTISYIWLRLHVADKRKSVYSSDADGLQDIVDDLFDDMKNLICEKDRNKIWIPYTNGDTNINNVWKYYYPNYKMYNKLRCIKSIVDPNNLFNTDFTVNPGRCYYDDVDNDVDES